MCFLAIVFSTTVAAAAQSEATLFSKLFNTGTDPNLGKVVVYRVNPNIMRILSISPRSFDRDQYPFQGDSQAMVTDAASISGITEALRATTVPDKEGCYGTTFTTAERFYVSWAVFFYGDQDQGGSNKRLASIFLTRDGSCVSTGTQVYQIDPREIAQYLSRTFGFMNF